MLKSGRSKVAGSAVPLHDAPRTLASALVDRVRTDIVSGVLVPGSKLRLKELAGRYETSVNPVREALARLAATGLVLAEDQRGFSVAPISAHDFNDLTRVKQEIYGIALRASLERGDLAWESRVVAAHHRLYGVTPSSEDEPVDRVAYEKYHGDFHRALIDACDSAWLIHFYEVLYEQSMRYQRFVPPVASAWRKVRTEHDSILKAALSRDADRTIALFTKHLAAKANKLALSDRSGSWDGAKRSREKPLRTTSRKMPSGPKRSVLKKAH